MDARMYNGRGSQRANRQGRKEKQIPFKGCQRITHMTRVVGVQRRVAPGGNLERCGRVQSVHTFSPFAHCVCRESVLRPMDEDLTTLQHGLMLDLAMPDRAPESV